MTERKKEKKELRRVVFVGNSSVKVNSMEMKMKRSCKGYPINPYEILNKLLVRRKLSIDIWTVLHLH